jgi:putative endonuclease
MKGAAEEDLALRFMQAQGLQLIARNVRCRGGELDLVMEDGDTVVVTEVRKRSREDYGGAAGSVDPRKQRRIVHATRVWLAHSAKYADRPIRFDVCTLDAANRVSWLRAAFDAEA